MSAPCHFIDGRLQDRTIIVDLAGCGGTGSQVLTGLARLHLALRALGHPFGLSVRAFDPDRVSPANVGRQLFFPSDVGQSKSVTLVNRLNCCYGTSFKAYCDRYIGNNDQGVPDIVITCIDTAAGRRFIADGMSRGWKIPSENPRAPYWLDCGNSRRTGQVFLTGGPASGSKLMLQPSPFLEFGTADIVNSLEEMYGAAVDLPYLWDVLPEIFDAGIEEDDTPSCSLAESLHSQDLFVNDHISRWALHLLWQLLSEGKITTHGYWINLADGRVSPVPVAARAEASRPPTKAKRQRGGTNG